MSPWAQPVRPVRWLAMGARVGLLLVLSPLPVAGDAASGMPAWQSVRTWLYQLQRLDPQEVHGSQFDLVVMDPYPEHDPHRLYSREALATLQRTREGGRRLLLAYLSIGEAEDYRSYWQPGWRPGSPAWLAEKNPRWRGNYKVRYWHADWQRILFGAPDSMLDRILAAGFDGVYLDLIDAYEYFEERGRRSARQEMIDLVVGLAAYVRARSGNPGFGIFPQNGEELAQDARYLAAITGLGREGLYYGDVRPGSATRPQRTREMQRMLDTLVAQGKLVLVVDYTTSPAQARDAATRARQRGYVPYCAVPALDRLFPPP